MKLFMYFLVFLVVAALLWAAARGVSVPVPAVSGSGAAASAVDSNGDGVDDRNVHRVEVGLPISLDFGWHNYAYTDQANANRLNMETEADRIREMAAAETDAAVSKTMLQYAEELAAVKHGQDLQRLDAELARDLETLDAEKQEEIAISLANAAEENYRTTMADTNANLYPRQEAARQGVERSILSSKSIALRAGAILALAVSIGFGSFAVIRSIGAARNRNKKEREQPSMQRSGPIVLITPPTESGLAPTLVHDGLPGAFLTLSDKLGQALHLPEGMVMAAIQAWNNANATQGTGRVAAVAGLLAARLSRPVDKSRTTLQVKGGTTEIQTGGKS